MPRWPGDEVSIPTVGECAIGQFTTAGGTFHSASPKYSLVWEVAAVGSQVPVAGPATGHLGRPGLTLPESGGDFWDITVTALPRGSGGLVGSNFDDARDFYLQRIDADGNVLNEDFQSETFEPMAFSIHFGPGDLVVFGFDELGHAAGDPVPAGLEQQYVRCLRWQVCKIID
jgi:hypothetical protein